MGLQFIVGVQPSPTSSASAAFCNSSMGVPCSVGLQSSCSGTAVHPGLWLPGVTETFHGLFGLPGLFELQCKGPQLSLINIHKSFVVVPYPRVAIAQRYGCCFWKAF